MLFQLGLNYPVVDEHHSNIAKLLGIRNAIAHGDRLKVPSDREVTDYLTTVFLVMSFIQTEIYDALKGQIYLRVHPIKEDAGTLVHDGVWLTFLN